MKKKYFLWLTCLYFFIFIALLVSLLSTSELSLYNFNFLLFLFFASSVATLTLFWIGGVIACFLRTRYKVAGIWLGVGVLLIAGMSFFTDLEAWWVLVLFIPAFWMGEVVDKVARRRYKPALAWFIPGSILFGLIIYVLFSVSGTDPYRSWDSRRASDIRQIELALELYYSAHNQYPTTAPYQKLIDEGYLNMASPLVDPATGNKYCYAYGRAATGIHPVQYYHIGARLDNEDSDLLCDDADYPSTSTVWKAVYTEDCPDTPYGFIGKGAGYCGELEGHPIYDRGVFPE